MTATELADKYQAFDQIDRLRPTPRVEWSEPVPGVHVAVVNGWSLCVLGPQFPGASIVFHTSKPGRDGTFNVGSSTIDAAKSAAVEWARKNERK